MGAADVKEIFDEKDDFCHRLQMKELERRRVEAYIKDGPQDGAPGGANVEPGAAHGLPPGCHPSAMSRGFSALGWHPSAMIV